jgi:post-segregation antitoxin (ccd killing protein)
MTVYVPRELRNRVKARLAEQELELSGLVEDMLSEWLAKQRG